MRQFHSEARKQPISSAAFDAWLPMNDSLDRATTFCINQGRKAMSRVNTSLDAALAGNLK